MAKKKQRGKEALSAGEKTAKNLDVVLESSDDEAPEEVTFQDSRLEALRRLKEALDTERREKELLKEKRRKRQELFQEQKKRKLFPAEALEEIHSSALKKQKQSEDEAGEEKETTKKKKKTTKSAHSRTLKGSYTVRTMEDQTSTFFQQQAAEEFLQSRLYGAGSCRTTSNELLSLQNKKGTNQSAALQFVRKDWACKEKVKAEKLRKRWIYKQRNPSS
ncbi:nucleolar protein 7 [Acanthochromis polyacanthus]|uniref:Nucleolar protein 7 n=1 Tax=Acanthochromis polyacanthus TaxID=80966 RepID=A0A3Q1GVL0_9TELE|nr:nucleolar protein 7 [Acanthochromis polyacanthus]